MSPPMSPSCQNIMKLFLSSLVPEAVVTSLVLFLLLESCVFALTSSVCQAISFTDLCKACVWIQCLLSVVALFSVLLVSALVCLSFPPPWVPLALLVVPAWAPVRTELSTKTLGSLCVLGLPRVLGPLQSGQRPGHLCGHLAHFRSQGCAHSCPYTVWETACVLPASSLCQAGGD